MMPRRKFAWPGAFAPILIWSALAWAADLPPGLPDFSYAGYHRGEAPIPRLPLQPGVNVKDFGAIGDGAADDTAAILKAIAATPRGVVYLPPGRYKVTGILEITRPGVVLRGAGPDRTTLYCPTPLNEIRPNWGATTTGKPTSNYSWSGGVVWIKGENARVPLAEVAASATRGERRIAVSPGSIVKPGDWIEIEAVDDADRTLTAHLYSGDPGDTAKVRGMRASLVTRVNAVEKNVLVLERALRFDLRPEWKPRVLRFAPSVTESGVEDLAFEFPAKVYEGHFTELGYNAVALTGTADCWARNLRIVNPDSGLFVSGVFNTLENIVYESTRPAAREGQPVGHHGVYMSGGDNLFTGFDFRMRFIHDLSLAHTAGNVFEDGKGVDLSFDHHKKAPYENLYTNIDAGRGSRPWASGGGAALGRHCGARGTFWNIRAGQAMAPPPAGWGPASMILRLDTGGPPNLRRYQLAKRRAG